MMSVLLFLCALAGATSVLPVVAQKPPAGGNVINTDT